MMKSMRSGILVFLSLLVIWTVVYRLEIYSPLILPSPVKVFEKLQYALTEEGLVGQVIRSIVIVSKGITLAFGLAAIGMVLSSKSKTLKAIINALSALFHPLPGIAILPIFMIWFGVGEGAILGVIIHSVLWPLLINLCSGINNIPQMYLQISKGYSFRSIKKYQHIIIPAILPYVLSGLRTGWARAWRALISAEMIFGAIGNGGGLGWFIFKNRVFMDTAGMFSGLLVVVMVGLLVEKGLFDLLEAQTLRKWGMLNDT